jgi:hypothetical protein
MKRNKFLLLSFAKTALITWLLINVSCLKQEDKSFESTSESITLNESKTEFINPLNFVGEYHNQSLDYVRKKYPYSKNLMMSYQDTINYLSDLIENFVNTIPTGSILNNEYVDRKDIKEKASNIFINNNQGKSISNRLSQKQIVFIEQLKMIFNEATEADSIRIFNRVSVLEKKIFQSDLSENEKIVLLTSSAVGKYSWKYWSQEKLENIYYQRTKNELWPNWKALKEAAIDADIMGAIAGAIGGCIGGAVVGTFIMPGVGSITACMLEAVNLGFQGAVLGSTLAAIRYLIFE